MVAVNRFLPLDYVPLSAQVLRRYGRGINPDPTDLQTLETYWREIDTSLKRLHDLLAGGEPVPMVRTTAAALPTWPAVGVAESEEALRSLLMLQFERIRQKRISWNRADGSTYPFAAPGGLCLLIDWARHG